MATATLLPNGKQQFFNANGVPLAGGSVYMYIPGTTTFKNTWQDSGQVTLNSNPIVLDSAGEALIYGNGQYRQQVYDSSNNLIWDQLTADVSYYAGQAGFMIGSNNLSEITSASTARTNLGLGTAATQNTGTSGANVPLLNGNNTWSGTNAFGTATATTPSAGDNSTNIATTAFVAGTLIGLQSFTTSGTYTPTSGATKMLVFGIGGGGGGGGTGTGSAGAGGNGGTTSLGSLLSCGGGGGGAASSNSTGGASGTGGTVSSGTVKLTGSSGGQGAPVGAGNGGGSGIGGAGIFGSGAGASAVNSAAGNAGAANTGAGGSGGGGVWNTCVGGAGGGSGGFGMYYGAASSQTVTIGTAGTAGTAGTSGFAGGAGGTGIIIVLEYK